MLRSPLEHTMCHAKAQKLESEWAQLCRITTLAQEAHRQWKRPGKASNGKVHITSSVASHQQTVPNNGGARVSPFCHVRTSPLSLWPFFGAISQNRLDPLKNY